MNRRGFILGGCAALAGGMKALAAPTRSSVAARHLVNSGAGGGWTNPYITDGLVAMWDSEWNAGPGVHDAAATVWKDLVGNANWELANGLSFGDDYITGDDSSNAYGTLTQADSAIFGSGANNVCVEFCVHLMSTGSGARGIFAGPTGGDTNAISYLSQQVLGNRQKIAWSNVGAQFSGTFCVGLSVAVNGGPFGSGYPQFGTNNGYNSNKDYAVIFKYRNEVSGSSDVRVHSFRLYSRALTAAEIAHNYAIDKARFNLP